MREMKTWEKLGKDDPLWAILSWDEKRGNKWDIDEFIETGKSQVDEVVTEIEKLGIDPSTKSVLDFGCGVGRVTQNFAKRFKKATGVDISSPMIENARKINKISNCDFVLNQREDLSRFENASVDVIFSVMVLQHNRPHIARRYIEEFTRIVKQDGIIYFQLPSSLKNTVKGQLIRFTPSLVKKSLRMVKHKTLSPFEMHCIHHDEVKRIVTANNCEIVELTIEPDPPGNYVNCIYVLRKKRKN